MRAAILARVSSAEQATEDRHSLPVQVAKMTRYAEAKGWPVVRVFEIPGESAYTDAIHRRPEFAAAMTAAENGEFDCLLIDEISRFARDQYLAHDSMRRLRRAGVQLWAVSMDQEMTGNPLLAGIFAAVAEESSRLQGAKIKAAKASRFARGLHNGDVPFGYVSMGASAPLAIDAHEATGVRFAFERFLVTGSQSEIAQSLTERGYLPHSKTGKRVFERTTVDRMLENRFYIGDVEHLGQFGRGAHEPIIERDLFDAVQAKIHRGGTRLPKAERQCSGLVVCRACQRKMITQVSGSMLSYYRDPTSREVECPNRKRGMRVERVHAEVDLVVAGIEWRDPEWMAYVNQQQRRASVAPAEHASLDAERRRLNEMYQKGRMEEAEYDRAVEDVLRRRSALPVPLGVVEQAMGQVTSFADVWAEANERERREALRIMLEAVEVDTAAEHVSVVPRAEYAPLLALRRQWCRRKLVWYARQESSVAGKPYERYSPRELVGAA